MAHPTDEAVPDAPRLNFDRRLKLELYDSSVTSDPSLLPFREMPRPDQDGRSGTVRRPQRQECAPLPDTIRIVI